MVLVLVVVDGSPTLQNNFGEAPRHPSTSVPKYLLRRSQGGWVPDMNQAAERLQEMALGDCNVGRCGQVWADITVGSVRAYERTGHLVGCPPAAYLPNGTARCVLCRRDNNIRRPECVKRGIPGCTKREATTWAAPVLQACPAAPICTQGWAMAGRGSPPTSNPRQQQGRSTSLNCGPASDGLGGRPLEHRGTPYLGTLPGDLLYLYLFPTCLYHHSTTAQARYRDGALPGPCTHPPSKCCGLAIAGSKNPNLLPSSPRIASRRTALHHAAHTHPRSPTCCVVSAAQGRAVCSLALELGPPPHGLHRIAPSSWPTVCLLASRISYHTPADSTIYVAGEIMTDSPPRLGSKAIVFDPPT